MTTFFLRGYDLSDFYSSTGSVTVSPGDVIQLAPTWDAASDYLQVNVTDDEGTFHGDANSDEVGSDSNQFGTIKDSAGNTLASGQIYLEERITLSDGEGNIVYVYVVEMGGGEQAVLTNPPIVPGVTYSVSAVDNVDTSLGTVPNYNDFSWSPYDAAIGQTYDGGAFSDQIEAGGGNDTVYSGGGADTVYGGDGNDTIYYGTGGATQSDGDTVYGGEGDDVIDDVGGAEYVYDDTLYGEGGNDILYGGGGDDEIYGGAGGDFIAGETGNDELFGGEGADQISGGEGYDIIVGGAGDDMLSGGADDDVLVFQDGSGIDVITDFDMRDDDLNGVTNDQFDVSALTDANGNPVNAWDVVVSDDGTGSAVLTFPNGESVTLWGVSPTQVDTAPELYSIGIPCYVSGTRIMTPSGEVPVEDLRAGDQVTTLGAGPQPLLWHGKRCLGRDILAEHPELLPVLIRNGTFGNRGDLLVSPQHGIYVPDPRISPDAGAHRVFARAKHLVSTQAGVRVAWGKREVCYHHLLLPRHAVIIANGALSESLYPGRFALSGFDRVARAELFGLFPALEAILRVPRTAFDPVKADLVTTQLYGPPAHPYLTGARCAVMAGSPANTRW
ncbi:Hemolysin-type calcium-binding repeat-containing protein [Celeribacter baekdonensis]|uniref:Hemolysin-type calcium-binding repeat-containing protein n=1 Tax=Celeribacter baekdonensis TaxID=875171 RepID=A0A1G7G734_9RHOB|nr:Hint domain-containing protein [Celeribacter baekdonensis]SDE83931.1 Hemolysin-type calcium-binding repeat-containing protein [Celeribacter baekdonensis]